MKLLRIGPKEEERPAVLDRTGGTRDLTALVPDITPEWLAAGGPASLGDSDIEGLPRIEGEARIGQPVSRVGKIVCVGLNYSDHAAETGQQPPAEPILFLKSGRIAQGPNDPIRIPRGSEKTDWEVELGVVIGRRALYVEPGEAMSYVAGYCVCNDVSERAFQMERGGQWDKGKNCETFGPLGPYLVTPDEIPDPQRLRLWLDVNGRRFQESSSSNMIFGVAELVSYISRFMPIEPGDVISTGTPPGVGIGQKPPIYLRAGDVVRLGIDGLGEQCQDVLACNGDPLSPAYADAGARAEIISTLRGMVGERLSTSASVREQHGRGEGLAETCPPDAVVFPASTDEIARIVQLCNDARVPVVSHGAGTSLEGHVSAVEGGICLDLTRMNAVLEVNAEDADCTVQAGVTREQLNSYLRDRGLFFPLDPGPNATIGGMAATRASGTNAVRYGTMREAVLSVKAVLADGRVVRTGRRARKSAAGYDLTRLFVGSEGTLGVISEVALRLQAIPECVGAAVCPFQTLTGACAAVIELIQLGIAVARVELLDEVQIEACNRYSHTDFPVQPTLFLEFHGSAEEVKLFSEATSEVAARNEGGPFQWTDKPEERTILWKARHDAYFAAKALRPNGQVAVTDVCIPISRLADCVLETRADIDASGLLAPIVGHAGDGNFHVLAVIDPHDPDDLRRFEAFNERLMRRALAFEGTCTGEHGVGMGKRAALIDELGVEAVDLMRGLKNTVDPNGIMNPQKIFAST